MKLLPTVEQYRKNYNSYQRILLYIRAVFFGGIILAPIIYFLTSDNPSIFDTYIIVLAILIVLLTIYKEVVIMRCPNCRRRLFLMIFTIDIVLDTCPHCQTLLREPRKKKKVKE